MLYVVKGEPGQTIFDLYFTLRNWAWSPNEVAIVCPVNMRGVMGAGLAAAFRERYPASVAVYKSALQSGARGEPGLRLDTPYLGWVSELGNVLFFATKDHWREKSSLEQIERGLKTFRAMLPSMQQNVFVFPPLGCGLGGLRWEDVHPLMRATLGALQNYLCWVFLRADDDAERVER